MILRTREPSRHRVNAPLVLVLLDDVRWADVAYALFELSIVDAAISRLLIRRLVRATPPPEIPPQIVSSTPFAGLVLSGAPCSQLRTEHDQALHAAGKLGESEALDRALAHL